ncbi:MULTISPECIES: FecR family protein [Bacteroidota]|uniref:Fec operon regulator FecR n=2 Tax=Bacteroidota TaxID=976 RepID=A0A2X2JTD7_SPHMU|nr:MULTISPECIES: FecR domain-containing protein [Bacteroidota]AZB25144.1 hypothetical protein EG339_11420 [Chryseobacterium bernardetii]QRQ63233.1 FecR domain-containing protein [Sphingobacterium multivorum]SPZ95073.1 fec operon regulator FecR [Sphingobacterium multivorum]
MNNEKNEIEPLTDQESKEVWEKLTSRIKDYELKKQKRKMIRFTSLMVAAILVLIGSIVSYRSLYIPDVYQATQNVLTITLKDGSIVTLSKGAKLTVEKSFPSDTRDVLLEGDAIFNVSKSKTHPFIVHAGNYQAKVLGTIFKVVQSGSNLNIDLYEGKVQVTQNERIKESYVIHPNETFSNLGDTKVAVITPTKKETSEKTASKVSISFRDYDLQQAISTIEKIYGIKIIFPENRSYSKISIVAPEETADKLLERVAIQLNLNIEKVNENTFQLEE